MEKLLTVSRKVGHPGIGKFAVEIFQDFELDVVPEQTMAFWSNLRVKGVSKAQKMWMVREGFAHVNYADIWIWFFRSLFEEGEKVLCENEWTDVAEGERRSVIEKYKYLGCRLLYDHHILYTCTQRF